MQNDTLNAWAAGLFEGEGTMYLHPRTGQVQCVMIMTDLDVLQHFAEVIGSGRITPVRRGEYAKDYKPIWRWGRSGKACKEIIERMLPYLGERRSARARECLAALAERFSLRSCPRCGKEFEARKSNQKYCTQRCGQAAQAKARYHASLEKHRAYAREWARAHREVTRTHGG